VNRADDFRAKARECDRLADKAKDSEARRVLREAPRTGDSWRIKPSV
jgi:hypothetical protein